MAAEDEVVWMVRGAWVSLCVRAMCELVVVGALDEPRSLAELAARTSSDPASLARLLRVLVDLGLLEATDDGRYTATPVLHDWRDRDAVSILRAVRTAMRADARLLVVENVLDASGRTPSPQLDVHLVALHMLVMFGARERTKQEYDDLLVVAGFGPSDLAPSPDTWNVMTTQPVS